VKVIGAGFGRTGAASLKAALETLDFGPCYNMMEVLRHPEHVEFWEAALRGEPVDWDGVLGSYEAAVDWPACTFYEQFMERHPDAKVLLNVRDPERRYESTRNTIYELSKIAAGTRLSRAIFAFVGLFVPGVFDICRMAEEIIWQGTFDGKFEDKHHAIEVFNRHNEEVRRRVPQGRLLIYEVEEGWGAAVRVPRRRRAGQTLPAPQRRGGDAAQDSRGTRPLCRRAHRPGATGHRRSRAARKTRQILTQPHIGDAGVS